jgi:hypothetical protein
MTSAVLQTYREEMWTTFFDEHHAYLTVIAEMLSRCPLSPERILRNALAALEGSTYEENSGKACAVRAVVETAIACNRGNANSPIEAEIPFRPALGFPGSSQIAMLPWPERAVYFLHGILQYSCRETALLLGMNDANIDQLYKFAAKRIAY